VAICYGFFVCKCSFLFVIVFFWFVNNNVMFIVCLFVSDPFLSMCLFFTCKCVRVVGNRS